MKQFCTLLFCVLFFLQTATSQRKSVITPVSSNNKINGEPFIILPQAAAKFKFSLYEYSFKRGDKLDLLIKLISNNKTTCTDSVIKEHLGFLEKKYDVNLDVLLEFIKDKKKKEYTFTKMDKDIKTSFVSAADYNKVFKYKKFRATSNSSLNLVYDENGILVSSKQTSEDKIIPTITSAVSGIISLANTMKGLGIAVEAKDKTDCIEINKKILDEIDDLINTYATYLKGNSYLEKQFVAGKEKHEEDIAKEFADLFYSKEVRSIPVEITFIIPGDKIPTNSTAETFPLFAYDKPKGKITLNSNYKVYLLALPADRIQYASLPSTGQYKLELSATEELFDRNSKLGNLTGTEPTKITAVYNIPKSERVRLLKPTGTEAFIDTIIKVPQHGKLGYYSKKFSSLELTYDANGELKSYTAERKSALDTNITAGAGAAKEVITFVKPKSEMELLKEKADKLELEKKIRELERDKEQ